jgi:phosphocarrier protein HPr
MRETFVINLEHGLHARPCALLVKTLRPFACEVTVEANGERASGHSIMSLMALAAGHGTAATFTMAGPDAPAAMAAVSHLFETRFAEAYRTPPPPPVPARGV